MLEIDDLMNRSKNHELTEAQFLFCLGSTIVYYSTPFGDHKDGSHKLFLLSGKDKKGYLPVFSTQQRMMEFFDRAGRVNYMIMENSVQSVLETTNGINERDVPVKMGIILDPGYHNMAIDAEMLPAVLVAMAQ